MSRFLPSLDDPNLYEVLGLQPNASQEAIRARYKELLLKYHPDLNLDEDTTEPFAAIIRARENLVDSERRFAYHAAQSRVDRTASVVCLNAASLPLLQEHLRYWDYLILPLNGATVRDKRTFIRQVYHYLPNPYKYNEGDNWDTLFDVLYDGFLQEERRFIAVVWTDAQNMLDSGLPDLLRIHLLLEQFIQQMAQVPESPICLQIFIVGVGPNYPLFHLI